MGPPGLLQSSPRLVLLVVPSFGAGVRVLPHRESQGGPDVLGDAQPRVAEYAFLLVVFSARDDDPGSMGAARALPSRFARIFQALGSCVRSYRIERQLSQQDMISYGFSLRHWQMIESGRPISLSTLLRICEAFDLTPEQLVADLSRNLRKRGS